MAAEKPTIREFADETIAAMRAVGVTGAIDYDGERSRLVHAEHGAFDLVDLYAKLADAPRHKRDDILGKAARAWTSPQQIPKTWDEASSKILPNVRTRMSAVAEDMRQDAEGRHQPTPRAEFTQHLVCDLAVPIAGIGTASVTVAMLEHWGANVDETIFDFAIRNLARRSGLNWLSSPNLPGVWKSPYRDGFDASRVFVPPLIAALPVRGRPVALSSSPSELFVAGSDDEEGLFSLARAAREALDRNHTFNFLRAVRLGEDGRSWEDWLPPEGHPVRDPLRLLRGVHEAADHDTKAEIVRRLAPPGQSVMPMPPLRVVQSSFGAESMTVTVWREGGMVALPRADAVVLQRGKEVLGFTPWESLKRAVPGQLRPTPKPDYPTRFVVTDFPEDWQLGMLDLRPWDGPLA